MSTILKALRRLEEEKAAAEHGRPLREQIAVEPRVREEKRRGWLPAALALVIGVGAGGGLIWWLFGDAASQPEVVATAPPVAPETAASPPVTRPSVDPPVPPPPSDAFASDVSVVDRPDPVPRLADGEPLRPAPLDKPGQRRPVESSSAAQRARAEAMAQEANLAAEAEMQAAAAARARSAPPQAPPAVAIEEPADVAVVERPAPRVEPAPPEPERVAAKPPVPPATESAPEPAPPPPRPAATEKPAPAPVAKAKPPAPVPPPRTGPEIQVQRTQWHPLADRRVAWLRVEGESDTREVVEGQVVAGMMVVEIQPSGVVLERDGNRVTQSLGGR